MALLIIFAAALGFLVPSISLEEIFGVEEYFLNVDTSINPCEDFYKFACGKYASNNPIPEDKLVVSEYTKVQDLIDSRLIEALNESIQENEAKSFQNLKKYYHSCTNIDRINTNGFEMVKKIIETLGGWPVVADLNPDVGWESVLYGLRKNYLEDNALISLNVEKNFINYHFRNFVIRPAKTINQGLAKRSKSDKTMKAYYDLMVQTAKAFGANEETAMRDMDLALDFERYLATNRKSPEEVTFYYWKTIEELEKEFPGFRWSDYMKNFAPNFLKSGNSVVLTEPEYTKSLIEILKNTPARVIRNYIIWKAIESILPLLNNEMRDLNSKYNEVNTGTTKPRSEECLTLIPSAFKIIKSALYIRKFFGQVDRTKVYDMVSVIKKQVEQTLHNTKWPKQDKIRAIRKIKSLEAQVGFPDELLNDEQLDSHYKTLEINEDNVLQNTLNLREFQINFESGLIMRFIEKTDWIVFAEKSLDVTAEYIHKFNTIVIPAGILQGNFFNAEFPQYINFGAIGQIIAHEILHGYGNVGRHYIDRGLYIDEWTEVARQDFAEKNRCLVEQFNKFTLLGEKINGNQTIDENLADLGGLTTSYLSYQNWNFSSHNSEVPPPDSNYTINQFFWMAFANVYCLNSKEWIMKHLIAIDSHAPNEVRVIGTLRNLETFSNDFNCPVGSYMNDMNPKEKCTAL